MIVETLKWVGDTDGFLELIDQRRLPGEFVKLQCTDIEQLYEAIKTLAVRGAPAIGVTAAYGLVLGMQKLTADDDLQGALACLQQFCKYLASSRPTAVNLFRSLETVERSVEQFVADNPHTDSQALRKFILEQADAICREDVDMCRRIGENGEKFITDDAGVLTHCNAGALATAGQGTALSVMFEAKRQGRRFKVYADETRPLLQGGRLTAWELQQAGIDVTVICDSMAAYLMKQGRVDLVITGADRIAANGDTANKIGTYSLSVLAACHGVPFYIAAPSSTFDLSIKAGDRIPIEERSPEEVAFYGGTRTAPEGVNVYNPAFDVTPAENITAIITDRGVIETPSAEKISAHFEC